jgi:hypothetical protein
LRRAQLHAARLSRAVFVGLLNTCAAAAPAAPSATMVDVCAFVRGQFAHDAHSLADLAASVDWKDSAADLPDELIGAQEAEIDFDNDGKPERVYQRDFSTHYMTGSVLLVRSTTSAATFEGATFLPCQWDVKAIAIKSCPPFSQDNDEAGFAMQRRNGKTVFFRARYAELIPFRFHDHTFVAVTSRSEDSADYVAVVDPRARRHFEPKCLLRRGRIDNAW